MVRSGREHLLRRLSHGENSISSATIAPVTLRAQQKELTRSTIVGAVYDLLKENPIDDLIDATVDLIGSEESAQW